MVRLQPDGHRSRQADRIAEARHDAASARDRNQILIAHELADGCRHLGRHAWRDGGKTLGRCLFGEKPVAEAADGLARNRLERSGVVRIHDEARDLVLLVRHDHFIEKSGQRHVRERHARRHALLGALGGEARELITRPDRRRLCQQCPQVLEHIGACADGVAIAHESLSF